MRFLKRNIKIIIPLIIIAVIFIIFFTGINYREIRYKKLDTDTTLIKEMKSKFNVSNLSDIYIADIYLKDYNKASASETSEDYLEQHRGKTQLIILYMFENDRNAEDPVPNGTRYYLSYLLPQFNRYVIEDEKIFEK